MRFAAVDRVSAHYRRLSATQLRAVFGWMIAACVMRIYWPALHAPFASDDYAHMAMARGSYPVSFGAFDLFDFVEEANRATLVARGIIPWWVHQTMVLHFFRPAASALSWLEYSWLGPNAFAAHVHSFLWFGLAVYCVYALARSLISARVAWIATAIFALSPCHVAAVSWPANRSALLSIAASAGALQSYARWRERRSARAGWLGALLFVLALFSGEYALGVAGYVLALEIIQRGESARDRLVGMTRFLIPMAVYVAVHGALHCGVAGVPQYSDPTHDPYAFLTAAPPRFASLLTLAWSGRSTLPSSARGWLATAAVLCSLVASVPLVVRGLDRERRRRAIWLFAGSFLSLGPFLAAKSGPKLVGIPMIGVCVTIALVIDRAFFANETPFRPHAWRLLLSATTLAAVHLAAAPVATHHSVRWFTSLFSTMEAEITPVRQLASDKAIVNVLRMNSAEMLSNLAIMLGGKALSAPPVRTLSFGQGEVIVERTGPSSIELSAASSPLFPAPHGADSVDVSFALDAGAKVSLPGFHATVLELRGDGAPVRIRFDFDRDLDDPSMLWIVEDPAGFHQVALPPIGAARRLAILDSRSRCPDRRRRAACPTLG